MIRRCGAALVLLGALIGCAPVHQAPETPQQPARLPATEGPLAEWLRAVPAARQGATGFQLITGGLEAYQWRAHSARMAEQRLHLQYYIWRDDEAGRLLLAELLDAAERGVDVALLLDDMDVRGNDRPLAALDAHPNAEVRLFNPYRARSGALRAGVELLLRASDLNHRMHNKAWIADGRLAIVGGRNISNAYFYAGDPFNFMDIDLAMAGPLAHQADRAFTDYWNSPAAIPIDQLQRARANAKTLERFQERLRAWRDEQADHPLRHHAADPPAQLRETDAYTWTRDAELAVDNPSKALGHTGQPTTRAVLNALTERFAGVEERLTLASPYFIPGAEGTAGLTGLAQRGVEVAILTNSLAATDVALAHSGYARRRQTLLEAGVDLYELRPSAWQHYRADAAFGLGASRASLHTKGAVFDGRAFFLGSFNLDPRSAHINTELGVFVRDAGMAETLEAIFQQAAEPRFAYQLHLSDRGAVRWQDDTGATYRRDPKAGWWRRFVAGFARLLPIESQL
nr:phospholipase D family protein [Halorhodospira halophila]